MVYRWYDRWNEGISYMENLIQEEKLKVKETVVEGFEKMPEAFIGLFNGSNTGKMVVKIGDAAVAVVAQPPKEKAQCHVVALLLSVRKS